MKSDLKRRLRKVLKAMLCLAFAIAMVVCLVKFSTSTDVFDKVNYGVWMIVGMILIFRE
jgi:magnesium-transporting ATPase (P-type)